MYLDYAPRAARGSSGRRAPAARAALLLLFPLAAGCGSPSSPTSAASDSPASTSPASAAIEITIEVASSVSMNGVRISSPKADNQGSFVAKFLMEAIKNLPLQIGDDNTLRIEGQTTKGSSFWGSKAILVVNNTAGK